MGNHSDRQTPDFKDCYEKYYKVIYRHIAYMTGSTQTADDLTQEAFIKLYQSPPAHANVAAWLSKVASNLAYNYMRDEKTRKVKEPATAMGDSDKVISIEDAALRNHEIRKIRKVLNALPPRDRTCLLLKFSGYRYDEIAEIIRVEKTSVGTILARSQAKFMERYQRGDF